MSDALPDTPRRHDARPGRSCLALLGVSGLLGLACAGPHRSIPLPTPAVRVGLERLEVEGAHDLQGQRIGLVAHAASTTWDGRHAIDVLRGLDLRLVRLFGPEHGLRGHAAAGEAVPHGREPGSDLPVVSLYGGQRRPAAADSTTSMPW